MPYVPRDFSGVSYQVNLIIDVPGRYGDKRAMWGVGKWYHDDPSRDYLSVYVKSRKATRGHYWTYASTQDVAELLSWFVKYRVKLSYEDIRKLLAWQDVKP